MKSLRRDARVDRQGGHVQSRRRASRPHGELGKEIDKNKDFDGGVQDPGAGAEGPAGDPARRDAARARAAVAGGRGPVRGAALRQRPAALSAVPLPRARAAPISRARARSSPSRRTRRRSPGCATTCFRSPGWCEAYHALGQDDAGPEVHGAAPVRDRRCR